MDLSRFVMFVRTRARGADKHQLIPSRIVLYVGSVLCAMDIRDHQLPRL